MARNGGKSSAGGNCGARAAVKRIIDGSDKKSVKLPSGKAGFRKTQPTFTYHGAKADGDNKEFVERLIREKSEFIYYKPKLDWATMRKQLSIVGSAVYNKSDGEYIEGMSGEYQPDTFYIEEARNE